MTPNTIEKHGCKVVEIDRETALYKDKLDAGLYTNTVSDQAVLRSLSEEGIDLACRKENRARLRGELDFATELIPLCLNVIGCTNIGTRVR